jgi:hypothetical protein
MDPKLQVRDLQPTSPERPERKFNRERFLFYVFGGLLTWQAGMFTYGAVRCFNHSDPPTLCPHLGDRYETFVSTSTAALMGLLGGAAVIGATRKDK